MDAPVVICIFKCLRYRLMLFLGRDEITLPVLRNAEFIFHRGLHHSLQQVLRIFRTYAFYNGIRYYRNGIEAYHAVGLISGQFPHRKLSSFPVYAQEGFKELSGTFPINECEHGMKGSESIPKGKHSVSVKTLRLVDLSVHAPVLPVHVGKKIGGNCRMIHGSIEYLKPFRLRIASGNINSGQIFIPQSESREPHLIEIEIPVPNL